jgi:2-hydroxychromene-2-carboxylate isomerase
VPGDAPSSTTAAFYFDLGSPEAYLAAERILHVLGAPAEWQPVLARELPGAEGDAAWEAATDTAYDQTYDHRRAQIEERALELDLQPLRWPEPFPFDSSLAMRVATYARSIGRTVPFAQAAFRQAFAGGRSLAEPDNVLIAAAACEMHPSAVLKGAEMRSVAEQLRAATKAAAELGVREVPAVRVGTAVFQGEGSPEEAAAYIRGERLEEPLAGAAPAGGDAAGGGGLGL